MRNLVWTPLSTILRYKESDWLVKKWHHYYYKSRIQRQLVQRKDALAKRGVAKVMTFWSKVMTLNWIPGQKQLHSGYEISTTGADLPPRILLLDPNNVRNIIKYNIRFKSCFDRLQINVNKFSWIVDSAQVRVVTLRCEVWKCCIDVVFQSQNGNFGEFFGR